MGQQSCLWGLLFFLHADLQSRRSILLGERGHLCLATYYSDDWVINFWNSESNPYGGGTGTYCGRRSASIIPGSSGWREFAGGNSSGHVCEHVWKKLGHVMDAAGKQGLGVILRVGYTRDYASPESALSRYEGFLYMIRS